MHMHRVRVFHVSYLDDDRTVSFQHHKTVWLLDRPDPHYVPPGDQVAIVVPGLKHSPTISEAAPYLEEYLQPRALVYMNDLYFELQENDTWKKLHCDDTSEDLFRGLYQLAVKAEGGAAL